MRTAGQVRPQVRRRRCAVLAVLAALAAAVGLALPAAAAPQRHDRMPGAEHSVRGPVTGQKFYFVMVDRFANGEVGNDTGGIPGGRLDNGYDPTAKGFYQGGDLHGLQSRLDYIKGLGTDAIWLTPVFKNKPVQLQDGPSAGYHGYWITDFTRVDPHLGTNQELFDLIKAAHRRGMKVFFDIITNHTADVIGYTSGARQPYVSKDASPYRTASGQPFDDRDDAGTGSFPALNPAVSFPYTPVLDPSEQNLKVPAWLNDVTLYHNRGDSTFTGENSQYGDFAGLDDLFTENPRVVQGMTDIYRTWVRQAGIDGFRIDTMKHVNDEFWQAFGPAVLQYARAQGKPDFFMFGEVAQDGSGDLQTALASHYTTHDQMQSVLDFPFKDAARDFASKNGSAASLRDFFSRDDWYTDADSNAYQLPTFLGNHDQGRIGNFLETDNPGAADSELLARDRLAHALMYFARGNPVVYYGDEQGFTGSGGDQLARQTMFASTVPEYLDDDLIGTTATHAQDNYVTSHPLYRSLAQLAAVTDAHPALRDGAMQNRYASDGPGIYAFSRLDRQEQREYVVALNNSTSAQTAAIPTYLGNRGFSLCYGPAARHARTAADRTLTVTVPALSAVVYESDGRIPREHAAPPVSLDPPQASSVSVSRMHVGAQVGGSSFYEVTFQQKIGAGDWENVGTDDNAPYQVYPDVSTLRPGTPLAYRAVVLDNAGHTRATAVRQTAVPTPVITINSPAEGGKVHGTVTVTATVDPERADNVVSFQRRVAGGAWTPIGTDSSSPTYTATDDLDPLNLSEGTEVDYRATMALPGGGTAVSAIRTTRHAQPLTEAVVYYHRTAGDYGTPPDGWGLHLWGNAVADPVLAQVSWDHPWQRSSIDGQWAVYRIALKDDSQPVNFIMHLPNGDTIPATREPGGDRSFVPADHQAIWLKQGDPAVYTSQPPLP
jgi:alpha-amylase